MKDTGPRKASPPFKRGVQQQVVMLLDARARQRSATQTVASR
ncbi:MAG: hypothetical protein U0470_08865 [Anaerolineae bacterium]